MNFDLLFSTLKYYCPSCHLPLQGNKHGQGHENENEAWGRYECEYKVCDTKPPRTSLDDLEELLAHKVALLEELPKQIDKLKVLRLGLNEQLKHSTK